MLASIALPGSLTATLCVHVARKALHKAIEYLLGDLPPCAAQAEALQVMLQRKEREGKPQHLIIADQVGLTSDGRDVIIGTYLDSLSMHG